ncbi:MAG TPA: DUF3047 domain-containing protein [Candidatus Tectomicrobia bacterium]|nr:DUF3047 domain-containing protein [Candidatus Tectomicrobia bacterium]
MGSMWGRERCAAGRRAAGRLGVVALLALVSVAAAAERVVVEDWSRQPVGSRGVPEGWQGQRWGKPQYDFTITEDRGRRALHLRSRNDGSTIARDVRGAVRLSETPVLEWSWKVVTLPRGGDSRHKATDDQAAQIYVAWERFPSMVRSRIIGYVWDTTAPVGTVVKSEKTGTVTYVVVRSGAADLGRWITERRNVVEDFRSIYGEAPGDPDAVSISIDTNDTASAAESFMGTIAFTRP